MADAKAPPIKAIATNRSATHDFLVHERVEEWLRDLVHRLGLRHPPRIAVTA